MKSLEKQDKHIAIFGAGGFIGNALAGFLEKRGRRVFAFNRADCDMLDPVEVRQTMDALPCPCIVVLCCCISRHRDDSYNAFSKNTLMIENYVNAASAGSVLQTIYLSSTDVYGDAPVLPISEETAIRPNGYYGLSKFACEQILFHNMEKTGQVTALRLPGIYGPNDMGRSILGMFTRNIIHGKEITVFGDGSTLRDFVLVDDLCRLIALLTDRPYQGVINVAGGESLPLKDILELIAKQANRPLNVNHAPPGKRSNDLVFDVPVLSEIAPSVNFTPLNEGIRFLVEANL